MLHYSQVFRVFISSTFSDLKAERDALQAQVFPRLRELCQRHGARFQAIDLRWGVSREASRDQQTMNICLGEIARCQQVTPRPNFVVLLGDRYGWRPPPPQIPAGEFDRVLDYVSAQDRSLLERWYRRDDNAVPAEYVLQPWDEYTYEEWAEIERVLHSALQEAAHAAGLDEAALFKYWASATHQEIVGGALQVEEADDHAFAFFRQISGLPQDERAEGFIDLTRAGEGMAPDADARQRLTELKANLRHTLGEDNVEEYEVEWTDDGPSTERIGALPRDLDACLALLDAPQPPHTLCATVWRRLARTILSEINNPTALPAAPEEIHVAPDQGLDTEGRAHCGFANGLLHHFVGRDEPLRAIRDYLAGQEPRALAVVAEGGSGKSTLMAKVLEEAKAAHPDAAVVYRFIGATPFSSDGRSLLLSLCQEISRRYGEDDDVPYDYNRLVPELAKQMATATADRPLILFLDALDQLSEAHGARRLTWLPRRLPEHVRLVVSTRREEDTFEAIMQHRPEEVTLGPMSRADADQLLGLWLDVAGRTLTEDQRRRVLDAFEDQRSGGWPLYLKLAFEEARLWPSYAPPELLQPGIEGVIRGNLLHRLSQEKNHGEALVARTVGYLAASRYGLAEDELLDVLSRDVDLYTTFLKGSYHVPSDLVDRAVEYRRSRGMRAKAPPRDGRQLAEEWVRALVTDPGSALELREFLDHVLPTARGPRLPVVLWSRLFFELAPYLTERMGTGSALLAFYHRELGDVAADQYLSQEKGPVYHRRLAAYFRARGDPDGDGTWTGDYPRGLREVPFHQYQGELYEQLIDTVGDRRFVDRTCAAFSIATMLDQLEMGLAAARRRANRSYAVRVLAAWGYTVGESRVEDRISDLLRQDRVADAIRTARHVEPPEEACRLLTGLARQALDDDQYPYALQVLQALRDAALPVRPGDLRDYVRLIDRFLERGAWEALPCLQVGRSDLSTAALLIYLVGTRQFSERMVEELLQLLSGWQEPYWHGVGLLFLYYRAARAGLPSRERVIDRLREVLGRMDQDRNRQHLQELIARAYRYVADAGLSPRELGVEAACNSSPPRSAVELQFPDGDRCGRFDFLPEPDSRLEHQTPPVTTVLRRALARSVGQPNEGAGWERASADRLLETLSASVRSHGPAAPRSLYWWSLLPPDRRPGLDQVQWPTHYALEALDPVERLEVLESLVRLGQEEVARRSLEHWLQEVDGSGRESAVYRTARTIEGWPHVRDFLVSAAERLRGSLAPPGPEPALVIELIKGLSARGAPSQATYWIDYLLGRIAPRMSFGVGDALAPSPARRDTYVLLNCILPEAPSASRLPKLRQDVIRLAERLGGTEPQLDRALKREYRTRSLPLGQLADRIMAFWAEDVAWHEPDPRESLAYLARVFQLGLVNDDRERRRSWFFWFLAMSADPTTSQIQRWLAEIDWALAPPQPYETMVLELLRAGQDTKIDWIEALKAIVGTLDRRVGAHAPALEVEMSDAVLRGFSDPAQQAAGMAYVAEACVRLGRPEEGMMFAATAGALASGFESLAQRRMDVAKALGDPAQTRLQQWRDTETLQEVYTGLVEKRAARGDCERLLDLTRYLRTFVDSWSGLLVGLCAGRSDPDFSATLLRTLRQYEDA